MKFNDLDFPLDLPKINYTKIFHQKMSLLGSLTSTNQSQLQKHSFTKLIHPLNIQNSIIKTNKDDNQISHLILYDDSIFPEEYQNNHEELFLMFKKDQYNFDNFFENLKRNIYKLFTNNYDLDFKNMEEVEAYIIYHIVLRKMKKKLDTTNMKPFCYMLYKKSIEEFKIKDDLKKCQKRSEENFKFLYKLFKKIQKDNFCKKRAKNKDNIFIDYYFKETARDLNIEIEAFSDPSNNNYVLRKNVIKKRNKKKKSLDFKFLKLILKSEKFKKDFIEFLNNKVIPYYKSSLKHKIDSLLVRIKKYIKINQEKNLNLNISKIWRLSIYDYLIKKKQCKIPWTISEIQKGIHNILNKINHFSKTK